MRRAAPFSVAAIPRKSLTFTGARKLYPLTQRDAAEIEAFGKEVYSTLTAHPVKSVFRRLRTGPRKTGPAGRHAVTSRL